MTRWTLGQLLDFETPKHVPQAEPAGEEFFSMEVDAAPKVVSEALADDHFPVPCTISALGASASGGALGFVFGFGKLIACRGDVTSLLVSCFCCAWA